SSKDLELLRMANKHFFQPLLPGFHSHLTIPVAFFSNYMKGRNEQKKTTAKLRSDASKITWEVKIEDGRRLTDVCSRTHDLRIGDIVIFRQEKDMAFHVTFMGPSCCEIQYEPCVDDENKLGELIYSSFEYFQVEIFGNSKEDESEKESRKRQILLVLWLKSRMRAYVTTNWYYLLVKI
ncbi:unnamed protein product, partial [Thlaspi arvense]